MEKEERIVDILMDDDEIEVIEESERGRAVNVTRERDLTSGIPYRDVGIEAGPSIKLRVLDIAIVIVAIILAYMIYTEIS